MRTIVLFLALVLSVSAAEFRAAVAKVDITPSDSQWLMGYGARKNTAVNDPIFHRIVVMDDGKTQFYLISTDVCVFSPTVYNQFAKELQQKLGINPLHLWWTTTHTHSAPEVGPPEMYDILLKGRSDHEWSRDYLALVQTRLEQGIIEARSKLAPARLAVGTGTSMANINRRARDIDGKTSLGLNPEGLAERQIGLMRMEGLDGKLIALVANYAMHGTVLGGKFMKISGDAQGMVAGYVEKKLGAPMLYINGAAGNLAPIYSVYDTPGAGHLSQFGVLLGDRILEANAKLQKGTSRVQLTADEAVIETARKPKLAWTDALKDFASKSATGEDLVKIPVRFLRINDLMLWAAPVELFCEISMDVRKAAPFKNTFYFGYTNGWIGYLPTAAGFAEGGYEPTTSPFTEKAEQDFKKGVLQKMKSMAHRPATAQAK